MVLDAELLWLNSRDAKVNNGLSLKSLAADLLNVCLDKTLELRCSDWEADELTLEQVLARPRRKPEVGGWTSWR